MAVAGLLLGCVPLPRFSGSDAVDIDAQIALVDARDPGMTTLSPVLFRGARFAMPADGTLGGYRWSPFCAGPFGDLTLWNVGQSALDRSTLFDDPFFMAAAAAGIDVVDRPGDPFERGDRLDRAEYHIAASIIGLEVDLCRKEEGWLRSRPVGATGSAEIAVDWYVYSRLTRRVVATLRTRGSARLKGPHDDALVAVMRKAFHAASVALAADDGLRAMLAQPDNPALPTAVSGGGVGAGGGDAASPLRLAEPAFAPLRLTRRPLLTGSFSERAEDLQRAVVTVSFGDGGFGSGFVISPDGYVLTNQHVLGNAERVRVEFSRERWGEGVVLRRDPARDVALIRLTAIPAGGLVAIPLRLDRPGVGSPIFVIGSPLDDALRGTVSSGIIAGYRRLRGDAGREFIQGDIAIYPGNSGGPLLDGAGNAIGLSARGYVEWPGNSTRLNLFIPMAEALAALNIVYGDPLYSRAGE